MQTWFLRLDNECSKAVKNYVISEQTNIQLVELHNHRVIATELVVKSLKYPALTVFATLDPNGPIQLWDQFTGQIEITLNLLRTSRRNKNKSAYQDFHNKKID